MPTILPPEWASMSAKEQTIWYLASLIDKIEGMTAELVASTSRLDSAASSATTSALVVPNTDLSGGDVDLTIDAMVTAAATDVSSSTAKAPEVLEVICGVSTDCIARAPITCSTDCSIQVSTFASLNEIQDATTTVHPEPAVDLIHQEVAAEIVTLVATTTDVDPKASVQELDDSPLPSINTSTQLASEADHSFALIVQNNLAAPEPTKCSAECPTHVEQQPWPPHIQVKIRHMGHLVRPSPWPSFKSLWDTNFLEEPCSDFTSPQDCCYELFPRKEPFSCFSGAQLQPRRPPDQAPSDIKGLTELEFIYLCTWSQNLGDQKTSSATQFNSENGIQSMAQDMPCLGSFSTHHQPRMKSELQLHGVNGQGSIILQGNCIKVELRPLPWPSFSSSWRAVQLWSKLSRSVNKQDTLQIVNMSVQWQLLNQEEFQGSDQFPGECCSEQCDHLWILLAYLMAQPICCCEQPFSYSQDAQRQFWRPLDRVTYIAELAQRSSDAIHNDQANYKGVQSYSCCMVPQLEGAEYFDHWAYDFYLEEFTWKRKLENGGSHNSVANSKEGACSPADRHMVLVQLLTHVTMRKEAIPCLVLQYASCTMILLRPWCAICDSLKMDPVICTKAWGKCCCQHLISTKASKLSLGKGRLNSHIIYGGINLKLWHPASMQCLQPPNFALAYLKWDANCAAGFHMFEQSTTQDWGRLLYFNQRPPGVCFGIAKSSTISLRILVVLVDDSVHHWLISTYAIIHIGGAQCKCVCSAPCLFGKGVLEAGSSQDGKNCVFVSAPAKKQTTSSHPRVARPSCDYLQFSLMAGHVYQWHWYLGMVHLLWTPCLDWKMDLHAHCWEGLAWQATTHSLTKRSNTWRLWTTLLHCPGRLQQTRGNFGGRSGITVVAAFVQGPVDHEYYLGFDHDCADNGYILDVQGSVDPKYFLGISFDWVSLDNNCCFYPLEVCPGFGYHQDFDKVQEHRAQWDPGGRRLGVKPSFKEGGC